MFCFYFEVLLSEAEPDAPDPEAPEVFEVPEPETPDADDPEAADDPDAEFELAPEEPEGLEFEAEFEATAFDPNELEAPEVPVGKLPLKGAAELLPVAVLEAEFDVLPFEAEEELLFDDFFVFELPDVLLLDALLKTPLFDLPEALFFFSDFLLDFCFEACEPPLLDFGF